MHNTGLLFKEKKYSESGLSTGTAVVILAEDAVTKANMFTLGEIIFCKVLKKLLIHPPAKVHHPQKVSVHLCALESILPRLTPVSHRTSIPLEKQINASETAPQHHT